MLTKNIVGKGENAGYSQCFLPPYGGHKCVCKCMQSGWVYNSIVWYSVE